MSASRSMRTQRAEWATAAQCSRTAEQRPGGTRRGAIARKCTARPLPLPAVSRPRLALLALLALAVTSCGGSGGSAAGGDPTVTLALDFTPNAVHAPIYQAVRDGHDRA